MLLQHGIFTVGDSARQAYDRMIDFVTLAQERLGRQRKTRAAAKLPANIAGLAEIAPILRGAVALDKNVLAGTAKRQILDFRNTPAIMDYVNGADVARYSQQGVVTPDHTIRTKNWPLVVPAPESGKLEEWSKEVHAAVDAFVARYHDYFARNNDKSPQKKKELDPLPRVVLVPGVGLFGIGASAKDAAIASDIAENTVEVISDAEAIGEYKPISEYDMFEVEYWSLEQAKLGKSAEKALARQVAAITGGGSGIGAATARAFAAQGAGSGDPGPRPGRGEGSGEKDRRQGTGGGVRRHRSDECARRLRRSGVCVRWRRYRGVQCRRRLAGRHRQGR